MTGKLLTLHHSGTQGAITHLCRRDKVLAGLIRQVGDCRLLAESSTDLFGTLTNAIISQQLSSKAAATIIGRYRALFRLRDESSSPSPARVIRMADEKLRGAGLSGAKTLAVKDLAAKLKAGTLPAIDVIEALDDEAIIQHLIQVRGIGRWTAEMFLMFQLGRPDVLPVDDLGVRKGFMLLYGLDAMPDKKALTAHAECWRPFRSVASWYLWRAVELKG